MRDVSHEGAVQEGPSCRGSKLFDSLTHCLYFHVLACASGLGHMTKNSGRVEPRFWALRQFGEGGVRSWHSAGADTFSKQPPHSANRAEKSQTQPPHSANTDDTFSKQPGHSHKQERHMQKTADMTLKTDFSTFSKQRGHSRTLAVFRLQMWSCICFVACLCGLSDLQRRDARRA